MNLVKITLTEQVRMPGYVPGATIDIESKVREGWTFELKGPRVYIGAVPGWLGEKRGRITYEIPRSSLGLMWVGDGDVPVDWKSTPFVKEPADAPQVKPTPQGEGDDDASDVMAYGKGKKRP